MAGLGMPSGIPDVSVSSSARADATFSGKVRTGDVPFDLTTGGGMRGGFVNNVAFPGSTVIGSDSGGSGGTGGSGGLKPMIYTLIVGVVIFAGFILYRNR